MKRKLISILLTVAVCLTMTAFPSAAAESNLPDSLDAPEHFGVGHYLGDAFNITASAPESLRDYIEDTEANLPIKYQLDYKVGSGSWHYTSDWDTLGVKVKNLGGFSYIAGQSYTASSRFNLGGGFPEDTATVQLYKDNGWNLPDSSITFRIRYLMAEGSDYLYSPWSAEYTLSNTTTAKPDSLINYAPTLISAEVKKNTGGQPILYITTDIQPGPVMDLDSMVSDAMGIEIWLKKVSDTDFKLVGTNFFRNIYIPVDVTKYFDKAQESYDAESYQIKVRYVLNDLRKLPQVGRSDIIYSPFSNVYSQNMPAWSGASAWASAELQKADDYELIPDILSGANMTKPITREEFAALALKLYEKVTGETAAAASSDPFTDTNNPEVLKAYALGITTGTSSTTFDPKDLTNRQEVATMLSRAIRIMAPDADFSTDGAPAFSDSTDISSWALEHVKFMSKAGIIKGTDGKFMPRATTTAQEAAGYAVTTREQALAMSVRIFEQYQ